jgi:hypothetical protein
MKTLATTFGRGSSSFKSNSPLTNDQLLTVAPSIFAEEKHDSRSERYTYIPTIDVLNGLRKEGFEPFFAAQSKSRIEGKSEFTKHMLRLRHPDMLAATEANEIILINSHDGTSSYQMLAGVFRFVCMNGMVTGDKVEDIRVPHRGNIIDNVIEAAYTIVDEFDEVEEDISVMKALQLTDGEQRAFAKAAISLKYDDPDKDAPIRPEQILIPRRYSDNQSDLWTKFNTVQEHLIRGGQRGRSATGSRTTARGVEAIDRNVKLNRALWILADEMAALKV